MFINLVLAYIICKAHGQISSIVHPLTHTHGRGKQGRDQGLQPTHRKLKDFSDTPPKRDRMFYKSFINELFPLTN